MTLLTFLLSLFKFWISFSTIFTSSWSVMGRQFESCGSMPSNFVPCEDSWNAQQNRRIFSIFASLSKETQQLKHIRARFLHISSHCKIKNPYPSKPSSAFEHFQRQLYKYFEYFIWNWLDYYYFCHIANLILRIRGLLNLEPVKILLECAGWVLESQVDTSLDSLRQWLCMQMINKKHNKYNTKTGPKYSFKIDNFG